MLATRSSIFSWKNYFSISLLIKERRFPLFHFSKYLEIDFSISLLIKERRCGVNKINLSISLLIKERRFPYDAKQRRLIKFFFSISLLIKDRRNDVFHFSKYLLIYYYKYFFTHKGEEKWCFPIRQNHLSISLLIKDRRNDGGKIFFLFLYS